MAVHAHQLWMAPYAQLAQKSAAHRPLTILDQHNAVYMIFRRLAQSERNPAKRYVAELEAKKLVKYEVETCSHFDRVVWVTQDDFNAVASQASQPGQVKNDGIVPICVDALAQPVLDRPDAARRVTFLGGLHYPPKSASQTRVEQPTLQGG